MYNTWITSVWITHRRTAQSENTALSSKRLGLTISKFENLTTLWLGQNEVETRLHGCLYAT
jgi:hypothetical protein